MFAGNDERVKISPVCKGTLACSVTQSKFEAHGYADDCCIWRVINWAVLTLNTADSPIRGWKILPPGAL